MEELLGILELLTADGHTAFDDLTGFEPDEDIKRIIEVSKSLEQDDDLVADANTGWITRGALRVVNAVKDMNVYIEQPCKSLDECLTVRRHTNLPFVIDELITGVHPLIDAYKKNAMDNVNIKISRVGGLTKAKLLRDICESLGIAMTLEDSWGGDITTAAITAIAGSTNPEHYFSSTDFNSYNDLSICENPIKSVNGFISVSGQPGLGVDVNKKLLGEPVLIVK
jgi:L-alanine-DL-glutamate epimerase-like enolase superfamily enzyme